jgi:hypothetical protein
MSTPEPMNEIGEAGLPAAREGGLTAGDLEVERGMARLGERDYRGAIPHFDAARALGKSASVPCARAEAHLGLREDEPAAECCDEAVRLDPNCPRAGRGGRKRRSPGTSDRLRVPAHKRPGLAEGAAARAELAARSK